MGRGQGLSVDISKADAKEPEDKIRILNCIRLPEARTKARSGASLPCHKVERTALILHVKIIVAHAETYFKCAVFSLFLSLFGGLGACAEYKRKVRLSDLKCEVKR